MNSEALTPYLLAGEHLVWWGQPKQGLRFTVADVFLIPFSILWGGFACFWEWSVLQENVPIFPKLWGVPFVLVGLYFTAGRFFMDAFVRRRTVYALTDRRVLISRGAPFRRFTALGLDRLPAAEFAEERHGRGTIRFPQSQLLGGQFRRGPGAWTPALDPRPQFLSIEDARNVFTEIQSRAATAGRARS